MPDIEPSPRGPRIELACLDLSLGNWLFDTSVWRNLETSPDLALALLRHMEGRLFVPEEVVRELQATANSVLAPNRVAATVRMTTEEMGQWYRLLRERWDRSAARNHGEAACVILASRRGWSLLMDDRVGIEAARERAVPVMRTSNLILSGASAGYWDRDGAWRAHERMIATGRRRLGPPLWREGDRVDFERACVDVERVLRPATSR